MEVPHPAMNGMTVVMTGSNASRTDQPRVPVWHWADGEKPICGRFFHSVSGKPNILRAFAFDEPDIQRVQSLLCCICRDIIVERATKVASKHGYSFTPDTLCILIDELLDANFDAESKELFVLLVALRLLPFEAN